MYSLEYICVLAAGVTCVGCVITFYPSPVLPWMILLLLVIFGLLMAIGLPEDESSRGCSGHLPVLIFFLSLVS